jgi:hypothetical protein
MLIHAEHYQDGVSVRKLDLHEMMARSDALAREQTSRIITSAIPSLRIW